MKVMEESNEVGIRASKAARFGFDQRQPGQDQDNRERLVDELNDLVAVLQMLGLDPFKIINSNLVEKHKRKVRQYMQYSRELGMLEPVQSFIPNTTVPQHPVDEEL